MALVSFGDAAAALGHRSRSTLYRLKNAGQLAGYLRPGGKGGAELLELEPEGLPSLREHVRNSLREQVNSPTLLIAEAEQRRNRPAPQPQVDLSFWAEYGRIAGPADAPLSSDAADDEVALMVDALALGSKVPRMNRFGLWGLECAIRDVREAVAAGARWDQANWDAATARLLMSELPDADAAADLRALVQSGRLPAGLANQCKQALSAS